MKNISREVLIEKNVEFIVLGTDETAYGIARVIHENYNIMPKLFGAGELPQTSHSKILHRESFKGFNKDEVFLKVMNEYYENNKDNNIILLPVSDVYTGLLIRNYDKLRNKYLFNVPTIENDRELRDKEDFYNACDKFNIPYPKTVVIDSKDDNRIEEINVPVVIKWPDTIDSLNYQFDGRKKVYFINTKQELSDTVNHIYDSGYIGSLVIQDFITGGDDTNYSLNAYVDQNGKVRMMVLGQALLGDKHPSKVGNHYIIYTLGNDELYKQYKQFLEDVNYRGFANFDIKYDPVSNTFMTYEVNIRFPASVFFIAAGGVNYIDFIIRDLLNIGYETELYLHDGCKHMFLNGDISLLKHVDKKYEKLIKELVEKKPKYPLYYEKDKSFGRWKIHRKRNKKTVNDFKQFG